MRVEYEAVCGPKFIRFGTMQQPLVVVNAFNRLSISCFFPKIQAVKFAVSCEVVQKRWFWLPICRGKGIPDFGHAFLNYTYFRPCGRFSFSSVRRPRRLGGEKRKKERRNTGKIYVRRHTMWGGLIMSKFVQRKIKIPRCAQVMQRRNILYIEI